MFAMCAPAFLRSPSPPRAVSIEYLVVAGGGGGAQQGLNVAGGGGGAGGLKTGIVTLFGGGVLAITVGAAGQAGLYGVIAAGNGGNSVLSGGAAGTVTALGGGSGGFPTGGNGGSGGGSAGATGVGPPAAGTGTAGQGNNGGLGAGTFGSTACSGGGGGGSGGVGASGGSSSGNAGGVGTASSITGSSVTYAAGGYGPGTNASADGTPGAANTGNGGGGADGAGGGSASGGAGGSGVEILRILTVDYTGNVTGSPTVTTDGAYTVIKFTASGTYTNAAIAQPIFSNVSLLGHATARPFIDSSSNKHAIVNRYATVTHSSGRAQFGASASHNNMLVVPPSTGFVFGTGAWMVACRVYCGAAGARVMDTRASGSGTTGWTVAVQTTTYIPFIQLDNVAYGVGGGGGLPAANLILSNGVEAEVKFSYDGAVLRCFVDGALSWSHTVALNLTSNNELTIGNTNRTTGGNGYANQSLREWIVVKGEAVYVSSHVPPSTYNDTGIVIEAGTVITPYTDVKLNLHGEGANASTTFTDSSSFARTVSVFGNAQISTAQYAFGGASMLFDGSGDYITVPNSADFNMPGDFCFELFLRPTSHGAGTIFSNWQGTSNGVSIYLAGGTGRIDSNITGDAADVITQAGAAPLSSWVHSATFRDGSNLFQSIGGEIVDYKVDASSITTTQALYMARFPGYTDYFTGNFDEIRIVKGQTPYKRSFIVQTGAHPDS